MTHPPGKLVREFVEQPRKTGTFKRILVIRRDNIGDLVCTTPLFEALRKHHPKLEIAALVNSYNHEVVRGNPNIDKCFVYKKTKHAKSVAERIKAILDRVVLIFEIRKWSPEIVILAKGGYDKHGLNFALMLGSGAKIVGFAPDVKTQSGQSMPDVPVDCPDPASTHEVALLNLLLKPLGVSDGLGPLKVWPNPSVVGKIRESLPCAAHRIAIHISAREQERRWGNEKFIKLIELILATSPLIQIMLFWAPGLSTDPKHPGDDEPATEILQQFRKNEQIVPVPTTNLTDLIGALSLCDLFVGADGGALHLAVALGKPTVALFENNPAKLNHWYPWKVKNIVLHSKQQDRPEVRFIHVDDVMTSIAKFENNETHR